MRNTWNARTSCFRIVILWLLYINNLQCLQWTPSLSENLTRFRRQASICNFDEFTCRDGTCIKDDLQCDGKNDCNDRSDETVECRDVRCDAAFGYRCEYGACAPLNAKCNGVKDCSDGSDEKDCPGNQTPPTNTGCASTQFACLSGDCVDDVKTCDGNADCLDNSDETQQVCSGLPCINSYRCKYGACVAKNARCNGVRECFDGSDEQGCAITNKPTPVPPVKPPVEGGCLVPKSLDGGSFEGFQAGDYATNFVALITKCNEGFAPSPPDRNPPLCYNGNWNGPPLDCSRSITVKPPLKPPVEGGCLVPKAPDDGSFDGFQPGDYTTPFIGLITKCKEGFAPSPPDGSFPLCYNGNWNKPPIDCSRVCPPPKPSKGTKVTCIYNGRRLKSCDSPIDGTIASIKCEYLYEDTQIGENPNRICKDGSWNNEIPECRPICGRKTPPKQLNIIGGQVVKQGDYPWHIGVYANDTTRSYLCGGSIINPILIISAAHCFTEKEDGELLPTQNYLIATGKYYRPYDDPRDENTAQYSTVKGIHVPDKYKGVTGNYEADIAVVILSTAFTITVNVLPVCLDWSNDFDTQALSENDVGVVVGWGYTQQGEAPSTELKELTFPIIAKDKCYTNVPKAFRKFLTHDKLCAGFKEKGVSVCEGDSGGGLTLQGKFDDHYFIRGVVSTSPTSEERICDANQYGTYTKISTYINFIKYIELVNRI